MGSRGLTAILEKGNQEVKLSITEVEQPYIIYYQQKASITERTGGR